MFKFSFIILLSLIVSNCSKNSEGGYTWGATYSPAWYMSVPNHEKHLLFDRMQTYQLCNLWSENFPGNANAWRRTREEISRALIRKGEDPMKCSNPQSDQINISRKQAREAEAEARAAKAEAQRAKEQARNACQDAWSTYYSCRRSGSSYTRCYAPSC
jgi:hypothetical protein